MSGTAEVQYASGWVHITCWAGEEDSGSVVGAERTGSRIFKSPYLRNGWEFYDGSKRKQKGAARRLSRQTLQPKPYLINFLPFGSMVWVERGGSTTFSAPYLKNYWEFRNGSKRK